MTWKEVTSGIVACFDNLQDQIDAGRERMTEMQREIDDLQAFKHMHYEGTRATFEAPTAEDEPIQIDQDGAVLKNVTAKGYIPKKQQEHTCGECAKFSEEECEIPSVFAPDGGMSCFTPKKQNGCAAAKEQGNLEHYCGECEHYSHGTFCAKDYNVMGHDVSCKLFTPKKPSAPCVSVPKDKPEYCCENMINSQELEKIVYSSSGKPYLNGMMHRISYCPFCGKGLNIREAFTHPDPRIIVPAKGTQDDNKE